MIPTSMVIDNSRRQIVRSSTSIPSPPLRVRVIATIPRGHRGVVLAPALSHKDDERDAEYHS